MIENEMLADRVNKLVSSNTKKEWPEWIELVSEEVVPKGVEITFSFDINPDIAWFAGHFPEQSVLPGVVQLHWATKLAEISVFSLSEPVKHFKAVNNIKFKTMILPEQSVSLLLKYNELKDTVSFSYYNAADVFSTGTLVFGPSPSPNA